jgi:tetratricopeptide (TPR) repeat protein
MILRVIVTTLILALGAGLAAAQLSWSEHTRAGEWAFSRGDFDRAEVEFRSALEIAQRMPAGDRRLETSLENLGRLFEHEMRMDNAQPMYELLLAVQEERKGDRDPVLLRTLLALARVAIPAGDAPTAEASLLRYLEIAEESRRADPAEHWRAMTMLARIYTLQERHDEALELQRRAIAALRNDTSATAEERAAELESLAQMELLHGEPGAAEELIDRAVKLRQQEELGGIAELYAGAAATAFGAAEPKIAEKFAQQSIDAVLPEAAEPYAARKVLADVSWLRVRRSSDNPSDLIGIPADPAALAVANARLETLLNAQNQALAPDDSAIFETVSRLAQVSTMAGELDRAIRWHGRSLAMLPDRGASVSQLRAAEEAQVQLLTAADRWAEAAAANATLIAQLERAYGTHDRRLLPSLNLQMELLTELKRKREAKLIKKRLRKLSR